MPDSTTLISFFATTVVASTATFLVVLNLRTTENTLFAIYKGWKKKILDSMVKDSNQTWNERGGKLQQVEEHQMDKVNTTQWWYFGYICTGFFRVLGRARSESAEDRSQSVPV